LQVNAGQQCSCCPNKIINDQPALLYAYRVKSCWQYHLSHENFVQKLVAHKKDFRVHVRRDPLDRQATEDYRGTNGLDKRCETEQGIKEKRVSTAEIY